MASAKLQQPNLPTPSALTTLLFTSCTKSPTDALPLEILHNLRHQHNWTDVVLHTSPKSRTVPALDLSCSSSPSSPPPTLISGLPPHSIYIHPTHQAHLIKYSISPDSLDPQREYVLPLSLGQKFTMHLISDIFNILPEREAIEGKDNFKHQDVKRLLLGMLSHSGMGGDGTVVYYIVQEGDVKPRQN